MVCVGEKLNMHFVFFPSLMHKALEYDLNFQNQVSRAVIYFLQYTVVLTLHILSWV